ncbi:MAG: O-antigen ligase family protein [Acidimicrobiaceae bacterium]|nr:O-antigen ligase family protein [Acidimicrobiaceae bacterium]
MAATPTPPESADTGWQAVKQHALTARTFRVAVASAALLVFTNGPVLLFSKSVLNRTSRWEDIAVWPFLVAAAGCGAALATFGVLGAKGRPLEASERIAAIAVGWFALAALASSLWSVDPTATAWRSSVYVGMALLAWAIARLDARDTAATIGLVAAAAVGASLLLIVLRPELGVGPNDYWKGVYTNRNSLAPLAAIGLLAGVRLVAAPGRVRRIGAVGLAGASTAALIGAGSRTAWISLIAAVVVSTLPLAYCRLSGRWGRRLGARATAAAAGAGALGAIAGLVAVWNVPTLSQRRTIWSLVWDRILQRPWAGHGFFTFWDIEELTQHVLLRRGSAHNSLVEVGLGLGLLGAVPFAVIVVLAARNAGLALWRRPGPDTWMWAALVAFLLVENVTESFVLWFSYSWVLLMAAALRPAPRASPQQGPGSALSARIAGLEAERIGARTRSIRARPWPERSVSAANKSGSDTAAARRARTYLRALLWHAAASPSAGNPDERVEPPPRAGPDGAKGWLRSGWARSMRSGWTVVALISLAVLVVWLPDMGLPLGNSDDGRILGLFGLQGRNFWDLGAVESRFGAVMEPFASPEYDIAPRSDPPAAAVTYAHHPPLQIFITIASMGLLGDNLPALRVVAFVMGSATVVFMALLLRVRGIAWGPTLIALVAMCSTGFFYVYARIGVGYSLLVASVAAVAWLRTKRDPPVWAVAGGAGLAALAAMQSWIAMATLGLLALWLFTGTRQRRHSQTPPAPPGGISDADAPTAIERLRSWVSAGWSPALGAIGAGAAAGALITAVWLLNATDVSELAERTAFRFGNDVSTAIEQRRFSFGEFLARQWEFASHEMLAPIWLRALLLPALVAGLLDRRTRAPTLITLAVAATLTFGLQQGAWIHRLWNFPWLAPATIGLAALVDAGRRALRGRAARLRLPVGLLAVMVAAATLFAVITGPTRDFYLSDPAQAGAVLEEVRESHSPEVVWLTPGVSTAGWVSYYLDAPVFALDEDRLDLVAPSDLVLVRSERAPGYIPDDALQAPIAESDAYMVLDGAMMVE